jgi:hypothetical protein
MVDFPRSWFDVSTKTQTMGETGAGGQHQLERALISVPLNLAEGAYSRGKNRYARKERTPKR